MSAGYPIRVVNRARELAAAGWGETDIGRLLERQFGVAPCRETIRLWINEEAREARRAPERVRARVYRLRTAPPKPSRVGPERMLVRMRELRDRGLSFWAVGQVCAVWFGEELSEDQVALRLGERVVRSRGRVAGRAA